VSAKDASVQALCSHLLRMLIQKKQAGMDLSCSLQLLKELLMQGDILFIHISKI